jgi:hypothetical protein
LPYCLCNIGVEFKYRTAADLFHRGTSERIWILSRPGKTEFSFDNFLKDRGIKSYTQGSGERILLRKAIFEFIKLKVYQSFLIEKNS